MSWKNAVSYAQGIAAKYTSSGSDYRDEILPLGARIGGVLQLQKSPFIRAITNGSLIEMPADAQTLIKAISHVKLNMSGSLYRFYVQTGDGLYIGREQNREIFLQVYVNQQGDISEAVYCTQLTRIIPETEEDQQLFMGLTGYGLGDKRYSLSRFQMEALGYSKVDINNAFGAGDTLEYQRDAGAPLDEFMPPFVGTETRLDDAFGKQGLQREIYFMPYRRALNTSIDTEMATEYLLITTELLQNRDGDASKRAIHVDFMVGIPFELDCIRIQ